MRGTGVTRAKRIAAGVMGLLLLAVVLLSVAFLAAEADHDCTGEDCPVCAVMRTCVRLLRRCGGAAVILFAAAAPLILLLLAAAMAAPLLERATPVSRKIRLNN